jgi:hypothetical protein
LNQGGNKGGDTLSKEITSAFVESGKESQFLNGKRDSVYVGQWDALKEKMV